MPYMRDSWWRSREFVSLEHMQAEAIKWCTEVAGRRQCRPLGGASPLSVFEAVEAETLLPLPKTPFVLARWSTATVGPDIHIKVGRTLYSVPWKLIGKKVDARSTQAFVRSSTRVTWSRPMQPLSRGNALTTATTRPRRSPSTCGPRNGAAPSPRRSASPAAK